MSQTSLFRPKIVRIGTRGSALARWQSDFVARQLHTLYPTLSIEMVVITTQGDRLLDAPLPLIGGKGLFTAELEIALHRGEIDLAVHSLKDLPTAEPSGLQVGAILARGSAHDVLISRHQLLFHQFPATAIIGTSSARRKAQLLHYRPDLVVQTIRGNVGTRLQKLQADEWEYDGIVLAEAGLIRLGLSTEITERLSLEMILPAPAQGALAVQCRAEPSWLPFLEPLHHRPTAYAVTAERAFLAELGGGCSLPVAAHCLSPDGDNHLLRGRVYSPDGREVIDVSFSFAQYISADTAGRQLADLARQQGASRLLEALR